MNLFLSLLTVFLLVLAFPPFGLSWTIWVALVPFFYLLDKKRGDGDVYLYAFLTGFLFYLLTFYWLTYVTVMGFILISFILAFYFALFARVYEILQRRFSRAAIITVPALWVALELIRAHLFTGLPWLFLGHSQYDNLSLIQISSLLGPFSVTFLIVLVNRGLYEVLFSKKIIQFGFVLGIVGLVILWGSMRIEAYDAIRSDAKSVKVSLVQGNVSQDMKWDPMFKNDIINTYLSLSREASKKNPDLIVWPEAAVPVFLNHDEEIMKKIHDLVSIIGIPLVTGGPDAIELGNGSVHYSNSAFMFSKSGLVMDKYDKTKLVPFGEYVPKFLRTIIPFIGSITGGEDDFSPGDTYTIFYLKSIPFGITICFEAIFPDLVRKFVSGGARFMLNLTNDAWFGETAQPLQDMALNVFSAVSNGVSFARATNTGISCFIDAAGRITSVFSDNKGNNIFIEGTLTDRVFLVDFPTMYTKTGDVFSVLCILMIVFLLVASRKRSQKSEVRNQKTEDKSEN